MERKNNKFIKVFLAVSLTAIFLPFSISLVACSNNPQPVPTPEEKTLFDIENGVLKGFNTKLNNDELLKKIDGDILRIPENVVEIKDNAFYIDSKTTIPSSVTRIDFSRVVNLTKIGENAFRSCPFKLLTIPPCVRDIENYAFADSVYTELVITNSSFDYKFEEALSIKDYAFANNQKLKKIVLCNNLKEVGNYAFANNTNVEFIDLSAISVDAEISEFKPIFSNTGIDNCTVLGFNEFTQTKFKDFCLKLDIKSTSNFVYVNRYFLINPENSHILKGFVSDASAQKYAVDFAGKFIIPSTITKIADFAFFQVESSTIPFAIKILDLSASPQLSVIGSSAFKKAPFEKIEFNDAIQDIGNQTFESCHLLLEVKIPPKLYSIKISLFKDCINLKSVFLHKKVIEFQDECFAGCVSITEFTFVSDLDGEFYSNERFKSISQGKDWILGSNLKEAKVISADGITSSVKIADCYSSFKSFSWTFNEDRSRATVKSLINTSLKIVNIPYFYLEVKDDVVLKIPVTEIGESAFGDSQIEKVTFPDSITKIGNYAFYHCTKLNFDETYMIPKNITTIGTAAFWDCIDLKFIAFAGINSIEDMAFYGCSNLEKMHYLGTCEEWKKVVRGEDWHKNCDKLKEIYCIASEKTIDLDAK